VTRENRIHVAVGVVRNPSGQLLIAKRAEHLHQGGLWEFPGGKVEENETVIESLRRELQEEVGITVTQSTSLLKIRHDYPDKQVLLDVREVTSFEGVPVGLQNQPLQWANLADLSSYPFPEANKKIVTTLYAQEKQLAREILVTGNWQDVRDFELKLRRALDKGIQCVQLRAHFLSGMEYQGLYDLTKKICESYTVKIIVNTSVDLCMKLGADGLHLKSQRMLELDERPVAPSILFGVSCHSLSEIKHAEKIAADYLMLGPVNKTNSHPAAKPIGIKLFSEMANQSSVPVIALGGVSCEDRDSVINSGGYGIAAISSLWY